MNLEARLRYATTRPRRVTLSLTVEQGTAGTKPASHRVSTEPPPKRR